MPQSPILLSEENSDDESNEVDQEDLQLMFDDDFYEESHIAIEDGEVSLDQITILSKAVYHPLSTLYLEHCVVLPDYPKTDPHGYTYCINVEGQKNPTNIDVRYSYPILNALNILLIYLDPIFLQKNTSPKVHDMHLSRKYTREKDQTWLHSNKAL
ncbi:hypothetical protein P152DRAFT_460411 [Eremomyces bilateralis CBS 781.70]|uniref:Uncharacterized protein n=1 Tax=Eremomyces bilateralis CBS 781.70 TaxID=1392243 RepID=A0A6G1FXA6_9PEZI|nr:uncharacterized protein P152DRAFT_460411 [Eremomyces bilateralis CBS 781.70]KAF1810310.1 hypothetical protein P152DRAFT_460411 [Eremomyces bilateralis CBS 781.70]